MFANDAEVAALSGVEDFEAGLAAVAGKVATAVVTRGAQGSVIVSKGERVDVAAEPVGKVVDTTGAGDQYARGRAVRPRPRPAPGRQRAPGRHRRR